MHRNPTPHTWMHRNHHSSVKCTDILPLTHENTIIIISQVNAPESPSHMNAQKSYSSGRMHRNRLSSSKCTGILPITHECTKIVTPQVNAQISWLSISHPSYMKNNAIIIPQVNKKERNLTPYTYMHWNHHPSSKCTNILPLIHECTANRHSSSKCTDILPLTHE